MTRPPLAFATLLRFRLRSLACVLALLVAFAPPALAHGAPAAKDQDTRLLADHNDDCGGDEAGGLSNCRGTHDLIALDVRELHDGSKDVVVFRFFLNGGTVGPEGLRDVLTLKAGGVSKTLEIRTTNNQDFTATGFASVSKAASINDGTRFAVEATVARDTLGAVGAKLTDFKVDAYKGTTSGDYMPGGYNGPVGQVADPTQSPATNRVAGCLKPGTQQLEQAHCYRLRGPGYYVAVEAPGQQQVTAGEETIVQVSLRNELHTTPQSLTVTVAGADGVRARFHSPDAPGGEGYSDTMRIDLQKASSTFTHLALDQGEAGASGTLTVTVTTDLGGRTQAEVPYTVVAGADDGPSSEAVAHDQTADKDDKGIAAPAPAFVLLALAFALMARRRA